jgi:hypothetical protein
MKRIIFTFVAVLAGTYVFAQNESYIFQLNDNSHADVNQAGYSNYSEVVQYGNAWSEPRNEVYVKQTGVLNASYVEQWGEGNKYEISQKGNFNYSEGFQAGIGNRAKVSQDGDYLHSSTTQYGKDNWIEVSQSGYWGQSSSIYQDGSRNGAVVRQANH